VRACGDGALLSGRAAAFLLGLVDVRVPPPPEVTARTERRVRGVTTRRSRRLLKQDGTIWRGVPVTTVARTLVDLAATLSPGALARSCHEAAVRYGTTPDQVEEVLARRPMAPGAGRLRRVLRGDERVTLSKLERRFLALLRDHDLPLPVTNRRVGSYRVDCRWVNPPLTVELDGYRYHHSRHAWERDRRREREARARGDEFRRFTYGDVLEDPRYMLSEMRQLLTQRPA
jgi:very-short-patch-repair endonuclease